MRRREQLVSAFILALVALRVGEGVLQLESWPLTYMPMFSARVSPDVLPLRIELEGESNGAWRPLPAVDFGLSEDELLSRLRGADGIAVRCAELGRIYNRRAGAAPRRLHALRARLVEIARPGVAREAQIREVPCPLGGGS